MRDKTVSSFTVHVYPLFFPCIGENPILGVVPGIYIHIYTRTDETRGHRLVYISGHLITPEERKVEATE